MSITPSWSSLVVVTLVTVLLATSSVAAAAERQASAQSGFHVFAFCHDTHDAQHRNLAQQAKMLKELGYDGAGHVGLEKIAERLKSLDDVGLQLYLAGVTVNLSRDVTPQLQGVQAALPVLKDRQLILYTVVTGMPTGATEGKAPAVAALRKLSDLAGQAGVRIGIYPHTGDWVATVPQAVALAESVDRENCGVIFNLCHFLRNEQPESLATVLEQASPHLVAVTINGADLDGRNDKDWKRLIQPLDQGNFDLNALMKTLVQHGYRGPVGIMCYGLGGDAQLHLARSIRVWRKLAVER